MRLSARPLDINAALDGTDSAPYLTAFVVSSCMD